MEDRFARVEGTNRTANQDILPQMAQINADTNQPISLMLIFCSCLYLRPPLNLRFNPEQLDTNLSCRR